MTRLALVMPYYLNPGMLTRQYANWLQYSDEVKGRLELVIVDDGSPLEPASEVRRPKGLPPLSIYRVLEDRPWHQHGARNLGAHVAVADWLLMTDMDHVLEPEDAARLLTKLKPGRCYTFARVDAPNYTPTLDRWCAPKPHPNSFAVTREDYWRVGGYDEDYCGIYGTDGLFRKRLFAAVVRKHLDDVRLVRYSREVQPDASTRTLPRKDGRAPGAKREVKARKQAEGRHDQIVTLDFPWVRQL